MSHEGMVDALREAHRVLKPDGLLIDLRPAAVHRRVGVTRGDGYRLRWVMRENFDDDHAADHAVAHVVREGWFKAEGRIQKFDCFRLMDNLDDFLEWLADFLERSKSLSHDWLVRQVERELELKDGKTRVVVSAPLILQRLRKQPLSSSHSDGLK